MVLNLVIAFFIAFKIVHLLVCIKNTSKNSRLCSLFFSFLLYLSWVYCCCRTLSIKNCFYCLSSISVSLSHVRSVSVTHAAPCSAIFHILLRLLRLFLLPLLCRFLFLPAKQKGKTRRKIAGLELGCKTSDWFSVHRTRINTNWSFPLLLFGFKVFQCFPRTAHAERSQKTQPTSSKAKFKLFFVSPFVFVRCVRTAVAVDARPRGDCAAGVAAWHWQRSWSFPLFPAFPPVAGFLGVGGWWLAGFHFPPPPPTARFSFGGKLNRFWR